MAGPTPRPPPFTTTPAEAAGDRQHSADFLAVVEAVGNRAPQAHGAGAVAEAAEAGAAAVPAVEDGAVVEASVVVVLDEDSSRSTGKQC